ncbi:MAG: glycogen synthase GlgA [Planctomycetes bacterium]|nr:glycogen synthase GlgA [Planctomycetota bacterium]
MEALSVCLVSSEVAPFAKTGGLADVTAALARYLSRAGHDVRTFLPLYKRIAQGKYEITPVDGLQNLTMQFAGRQVRYSIHSTPITKSDAKLYLVHCPEFYDREGIYAADGDEHLRFAFLSRAAIEACQHMQFSPHVFHCNDWHTALIPLYLRTVYAWDRLFTRTRTVLTLHNNAYQGIFPTSVARDIGLGNETKYFHQEDWREGRLGFLKTGIIYATAVSTVSKTYAREIQGEELGMGLQDLMRQRDDHMFGILNGVDVAEWSPATDTLIPHRFTADDLSGKALMKRALMQKANLPYDPRAPVVGIVSRFTAQKGFDLLADAMTVFLQREDMRMVVLGSGEERFERQFDWLAKNFPKKVAYKNGYDNELAHWIEAGADIFLMPSRFEPCGLNQMYSMAYGTVPLVRKTGGLADTVQQWNPATQQGTGFVFEKYDAQAFFDTLQRALRTYRDDLQWRRIVQNGMAQDFSWERQIERYVEMYRRLPQL